MAATEPHLPPPLDVDAQQRPDRRGNTSPLPAQSKRDKRRQMLTEKIAALSDKFNRERDVTYREHLQKLQIDTTLAMRIDPYQASPLDFLGQDRRTREKVYNQDPDPEGRGGGRGLLEMAGPTFAQFAQQIEDLVEERDYELTKQKYEYERKEQEYTNVHTYKVEVARREHRALAQTLRDRLINTITAKKLRLTKEKEALEINDSSALLLHPNQFSINNPSSPGGTHTKRATRLRQNADELAAFGEGRKRKRNGADDDGSPAPQRRAVDGNGTTPLWQNERLAFRKVTGPVYSIDKLFTDKELSLTYNAAALASHKFLLTHHHKVKVNGNGQVVSSPSDSDSGDQEDGDRDAVDSAPSAVMMERVPSHATRSTRGGAPHPQNFLDDKLVGLEALANFEMPGNLEKMIAAEPKMPPMFLGTYARPHAKSEANTPATLPVEDVNSDLMVMGFLRQYENIHGTGSSFDSNSGGRKVLEAAAFSPNDRRYVAYLRHERQDPDELRKDLKIQTSSVRDDPSTPSGSGSAAAAVATSAPIGASPMSRQSSQGGAAMSRQGSNTRAQRKRNQ